MTALRRRAAALLAALPLVGCSAVPVSGPVNQGPVVDSGESTQFIRVIAAPPSVGATSTEIVQGFLDASASLEDDHGIARRYLTEEAATVWAPSGRVAVYAQDSLRVRGSGAQVRVSMRVTGELLDDGAFRAVEPAAERVLSLRLERVSGRSSTGSEWRIASPPDDLLISEGDLRRAYRQHQVFFLSERTDTLVPDGRLIPVVGAGLPTTLAEEVLAGPAAWLAPGIRGDLPTGVDLAFGAVPVEDGIARVELTDTVLTAAPEQLRALAAELTWTLTGLPEIDSVRLLVAGEPLDIPGAQGSLDRSSWRAVAPDHVFTGPTGATRPAAFLLKDAQVVRVSGNASTRVDVPDVVPEAAGSLAISIDEKRAAVVGPGGGALWLFGLGADASPTRIPGTDIRAGSFDADGGLWFVSAGRLLRASAGGRVHRVEVDLRPDARLTGVRVSPDGTRVALLVDGTLMLSVRVDTDDGTALTEPRPIAVGVGSCTDLAWRSATEIDVLGTLGDDQPSVVRVRVGTGELESLRSPTGTREIAAAPGVQTLAETSTGFVYGNVGLQWRPQGSATSIAYPG